MLRSIAWISAFFLGCLSWVSAQSADTLNPTALMQAYSEGEFESLTRQLEDFRAQHAVCRKSDSALVAKFLGVIYVANPASREKGKYWFYKLLQIDPRAELVDLFVSEEIQGVFDRVRQELIARRHYQGVNDADLHHQVHAGGNAGKDTVVLRDTVVVKNSGLPEAILGLASSLETAPPAFAEKEKKEAKGWTGNINAFGGMKFMDGDAWSPVHEQYAVGLSTDIRKVAWPVNIMVNFLYSQTPEVQRYNSQSGETSTYTSNTQELFFGIRELWDRRFLSVRPFFGGGLGIIAVEYQKSGLTALKQTGPGVWGEVGVYWELEQHFNLGTQIWWSWANIDYGVDKANAGGFGFAIVLGFHY